MTTIAFKISLELAHAPSEEGVAQLSNDLRRYLCHMLDVAQIDGEQVESSDVSVVASGRRRIAGMPGVTRGG